MDFDVNTASEVLARTPATMHALLGGLSEPWVRGTEGPETFSPFDVVGHLIDGEETDWMDRARIILSRDPDKRFAPYDRYRMWKRTAGRSLAALLEDFARLRAANLQELASWELSAEQLALTGVHPSFGNVSMRQLLAAWVVHDLGHIAQAARVMAKQYREAVGPWIEYLPVLTDHEKPRS